MPFVSPARPAPPSPARRPGRRRLLQAVPLLLGGLALSPALSACGPIELGQPATYTPPPAGIDDLYRPDLLAQLDLLILGVAALTDAADAADPSAVPDGTDPELLAAALSELAEALPVQRTALLTGAQLEAEQEAASESASAADGGDASAGEAEASADASTAPSAEAPTDVDGLLTALIAMRDLGVDAARQVSGSLSRPVAAITAHMQFAADRLVSVSGSAVGTAIPAAEDIVPTRTVPEQDPPSIGAASDYELALIDAQEQEWYAGYVHEVLSARTSGDQRTAHTTLSEAHRARAEVLGEIAAEDEIEVVDRQAVYALPGGELDEATAAGLPVQVSSALLVSHLALTGAAPFARRSTSIPYALAEASTLAGLGRSLDPVPSLTVEDQPAG